MTIACEESFSRVLKGEKSGSWSFERSLEKGAQKSQPCDEAAEIVSGGGEDEIYGVALSVGEMVSSRPAVVSRDVR